MMPRISRNTSTLQKRDHDLEERSNKRSWKTPKVVQRGVKKTNGKPITYKDECCFGAKLAAPS